MHRYEYAICKILNRRDEWQEISAGVTSWEDLHNVRLIDLGREEYSEIRRNLDLVPLFSLDNLFAKLGRDRSPDEPFAGPAARMIEIAKLSLIRVYSVPTGDWFLIRLLDYKVKGAFYASKIIRFKYAQPLFSNRIDLEDMIPQRERVVEIIKRSAEIIKEISNHQAGLHDEWYQKQMLYIEKIIALLMNKSMKDCREMIKNADPSLKAANQPKFDGLQSAFDDVINFIQSKIT